MTCLAPVVAHVARVRAAPVPVPVTLVFGVSAVVFVLAVGVSTTLIVAAVAGMLPVASLAVTAAAAEQAINQTHRSILLCGRLRATFSVNVPSLPGRKLEASLDGTMNGWSAPRSLVPRGAAPAQRRRGRSADAVTVSGRASAESAEGASGRTMRKIEPPPGRAR